MSNISNTNFLLNFIPNVKYFARRHLKDKFFVRKWDRSWGRRASWDRTENIKVDGDDRLNRWNWKKNYHLNNSQAAEDVIHLNYCGINLTMFYISTEYYNKNCLKKHFQTRWTLYLSMSNKHFIRKQELRFGPYKHLRYGEASVSNTKFE